MSVLEILTYCNYSFMNSLQSCRTNQSLCFPSIFPFTQSRCTARQLTHVPSYFFYSIHIIFNPTIKILQKHFWLKKDKYKPQILIACADPNGIKLNIILVGPKNSHLSERCLCGLAQPTRNFNSGNNQLTNAKLARLMI